MSKTKKQLRKRTDFKTQTKENRSKTNQKWKKSSDINEIVRKNRPQINQRNPELVQGREEALKIFDTGKSFNDKMNELKVVENEFNALPAETRAYFENDVAQCIDFVTNPANREEAVQLGLLPRDMSGVKYVDENGNDITAKVVEDRGLYIDGVKVDKYGRPLEKQTEPEKSGGTI